MHPRPRYLQPNCLVLAPLHDLERKVHYYTTQQKGEKKNTVSFRQTAPRRTANRKLVVGVVLVLDVTLDDGRFPCCTCALAPGLLSKCYFRGGQRTCTGVANNKGLEEVLCHYRS